MEEKHKFRSAGGHISHCNKRAYLRIKLSQKKAEKTEVERERASQILEDILEVLSEARSFF